MLFRSPRDFVPWRFSDAGKQRAQLNRRDAASEKPAQNCDLRQPSGVGLAYNDKPTFSPEGRLSAGKRTLGRDPLNFGFVPEADLPFQRNSDRFHRPMPLSSHLNQRSSLLDRLCPSVSNTLVPFSLSLNASTYAHTFVWRRMQWASAAVHPETSEERFDEQPERHNRRRGSRARGGLFRRLLVGQRHRRRRRTDPSRHNRKRRLISAAPLAASPARRPGQEQSSARSVASRPAT